jgi:YHS domain-containing protein
MTKDPVCGADVDERKAPAMSTYKGKHYLFCGQKCKDTFDKDPPEYIRSNDFRKTTQ